MRYLITLSDGISGVFEAATPEEAKTTAQSEIDAVALQFPDATPPEIVNVEAING